MQKLIEKMERAIAIDKQDAASSEVAEIKAVARARWPMLSLFAFELKEASAAVDAALDAKSKLVSALERENAELRGGNDEVLYEHFVTMINVLNYECPDGMTISEAIAENISIVCIGGWRFVSAALTDVNLVLFYERPLPTTDKNEAVSMITDGRLIFN